MTYLYLAWELGLSLYLSYKLIAVGIAKSASFVT